MKKGHPNRAKDPTPDEIAEACRRIRSTWSADETERRSLVTQADDLEFVRAKECKRRWHSA